MMEIDLPEPRAELEEAFARYEVALMANDVPTLDVLFATGPRVIRYGVDENLYGSEAIHDFRAARSALGIGRRLFRTEITTFGHDFGVAATLFHRDATPGKIGRQMQTWVRFAEGWRIVAAHVSVIDEV